MALTLYLTHPKRPARRVEVERSVAVGSRATLQLDGGVIERTHAMLDLEGGQLFVRDHGSSRTGTFLNEVRIEGPCPVGPNDVVRIGEWRLALREGPYELPAFEPRTPEERAFLGTLAAGPTDADLRAVYADWLVEHGHAGEAELLRIEDAIARDDAVEGRLGYRLSLLASRLPFAWRAIVTCPRILGCPSAETCPRSWDRLAPRPGSLVVRDCTACARAVEFVTEGASAVAAITAGRRAVMDHATRVDLEMPRDVSVTEGDFGLPFFASSTPPTVARDVLTSLKLAPPPDGTHPGAQAWFAVQGSGVVRSAFLRCSWGGPDFDDHPLTIAGLLARDCREIRLVLDVDAGDLEAWLHARNGAPRVLAHHRVYGRHWVMRTRGAQVCLSWHASLPNWALPPTDRSVTLAFLRELAALFAADADHATVERFASRPPEGAGVVVLGRTWPASESGRFRAQLSIRLAPSLDARDVTEAMGMTHAYAGVNGYNSYLWQVYFRRPSGTHAYAYASYWLVEPHVEGVPASARRDGLVTRSDVPLDGSVFIDAIAFA